MNDVDRLPTEERARYFEDLGKLYPSSFWVDHLILTRAQDLDQRLQAAAVVVRRYPHQHPQNYLRLAQVAVEAREPGRAIEALQAGLAIFHEEAWVARGRRLDRETYLDLVSEMRSLLTQLLTGQSGRSSTGPPLVRG